MYHLNIYVEPGAMSCEYVIRLGFCFPSKISEASGRPLNGPGSLRMPPAGYFLASIHGSLHTLHDIVLETPKNATLPLVTASKHTFR